MNKRAATTLMVLVLAASLASSCSSTPAQTGKNPKLTPVDKMRVLNVDKQPSIKEADYRLKVSGLVQAPQSLTLNDLKVNPVERIVTLPCVEGWSETQKWKGPTLLDVLNRAGLKQGVKTVVFSSPGGYSTSLTLADVKKTDPILAYEVGGVPLPADQGYPIRLVVPLKLGYKWIKWVTGIKLISGNYEGYWESRGYDNTADAGGR